MAVGGMQRRAVVVAVAMAAMTGVAAPASARIDQTGARCFRETVAAGIVDPAITNPGNTTFVGSVDDEGPEGRQIVAADEVYCGFGGLDLVTFNYGTFFGGDGNDIVAVNEGTFHGGAGTDFVGTNRGTFHGGSATDSVALNDVDGTFFGGDGDDHVTTNLGTFFGGDGDDRVVEMVAGLFDGGAGVDTVESHTGGTLVDVENHP